MKNPFGIKNLADPISIREAASKNYVDIAFKNPSILKKVKMLTSMLKKLENLKFVKINCQPAVDSHLTPKTYDDNATDETFIVGNNQDNDFNSYNLPNINSITMNTQAVNDNHVNTESHVDQFHQENERIRREVGLNFHNESNDLV